MKRYWKAAQALALLAMLNAVGFHGVYTFYIHHGLQPIDGFWGVVAAVFSAVFIVAPVAALFGLFRHRVWGFVPLAAFPFAAFVFGISAIPLLGHLVPAGSARSVAVGAINLAFVVAVIYLMRQCMRNAVQQITQPDGSSAAAG
jgi:hypothetical protein